MRSAIAFLVVVLTVMIGSRADAECRPLEYAELKDMPAKELTETLCRYTYLTNTYQEYILKLLKIGNRPEVEKSSKQYEDCSMEVAKMRAFAKRHSISTVPCKPLAAE